MKSTFIFAACICLGACTPKAEREYGYDKIMPPELKDCKVFTISDGSRELYVTRCGFDTSTAWNEYCGKGCVRQMDSNLIGEN